MPPNSPAHLPPDPPTDRRRENPDAGALCGWATGYFTGPSLYVLARLAAAELPVRALLSLLCPLAGVAVLGMVLMPLGLIGGRVAVWVRNRRAAAWPARPVAFVGAFLTAAALWPAAFVLWSIADSP